MRGHTEEMQWVTENNYRFCVTSSKVSRKAESNDLWRHLNLCKPPWLGLIMPSNRILQGSITKSLEALYRHLQGTSCHDFLLKVSITKETSEVIENR